MRKEVLIIGGGVIGLSIARSLFKKGFRKITILEKRLVGSEASYAAAGMLAPQSETESIDDFFRICSQSNEMYPEFARELFEETGIDIELDQPGTFFLAFSRDDSAVIERLHEIQTKAGLKVEHLTAQDIKRAEPFVSPDVREGLFFANEGQVENRKLLAALEKFARINAIDIEENCDVSEILFENGDLIGVVAGGKKRFADEVIIATGAWTSLIKCGEIRLPKVKPIRGQMLSFHTAKRLFSHVIYSPRGYIVPRKFGKILAGATVEDVGFDGSFTEIGIENVRQNALEIAPSLAGLPVDEKWAGLRPFSRDGLPVLGSFPQCGNVHIATAHYRNGILLAPITAQIIADNVAGTASSEFLSKFGLERFLRLAA